MTIELYTIYLFFLYFILAALAIGILFYIWKKARRFFKSPELHGLTREAILKKWDGIEELLERNEETAWKLAVMEADKLLDHALKSMAASGENLGERLRFISFKYPQIRRVWGAHNIRNRLAHEADFHLSQSAAKQAMKDFKKALEILGIL